MFWKAMQAASVGVVGVVLWGMSALVILFALSRRRPVPAPAWPELHFFFLVPALNEGKVIGPTVRHLLSLNPAGVVVVDDGSDDDTSERVAEIRDPRVHLLRRDPPAARQGKGRALNHAWRWLLSSGVIGGLDLEKVILCVMDADGRLSPGALREVTPYFSDPRVGSCQIAVRIRNRGTNFLTLMQHFEFVAFNALCQRGRERTKALQLGGNGQFTRASALASLGEDPWSDCLTEDMDLGIRLLLAGWENAYAATAWVSQQALPDLSRLLRQRTRWFQGTLQCLRHLPAMAGSSHPGFLARLDLAGILLSPLAMVISAPFFVLGYIWLGLWLAAGGGLSLTYILFSYGLGFLPAFFLSYTFWLEEPEVTLVQAILLGQLFVFYSYIWVPAGFRAIYRQLAGRSGWAKTPRVAEPNAAPMGVRA